jgi:subfamily B ATP-binding cassette protein MsbA
VLQQLNIDIAPNTTVAFVGPSGAGKTTLVDLMTGLLHPQSGSLQLDGQDLKDVQADTWRSKIGYVAQDLTVFDDTVANNIALFREEATPEDIEQAARMASAHTFISELPQGYQTRIGDKGVRLSGGQKQRLFIARELFKQPDLLILDEATSALDSASERYIQDSIDQLKGKITVIIIAHRLSTIKNADVIYVLDKGKVIESGSYEALMNKTSSRFAEMVELQSF